MNVGYYAKDASKIDSPVAEHQFALWYVLALGILQIPSFFFFRWVLGLLLGNFMDSMGTDSGLSGAALVLVLAVPLRLIAIFGPVAIVLIASSSLLKHIDVKRAWIVAICGAITSYFYLSTFAPRDAFLSWRVLFAIALATTLYVAIYFLASAQTFVYKIAGAGLILLGLLTLPLISDLLK
jgi:hypothetical protein